MNKEDKATMTEEILRPTRYKFNISPIKVPLTKEGLEKFDSAELTDKLCEMLEEKGFTWVIETTDDDSLHEGKKIIGEKKDRTGYPVFFEMTMKNGVTKPYHISFPLEHQYNYATSFTDMKKWLVYAILVLDKIRLQ